MTRAATKLEPCPAHPRPLFPWDRPRRDKGHNSWHCPLCRKEEREAKKRATEKYFADAWNKHATPEHPR